MRGTPSTRRVIPLPVDGSLTVPKIAGHRPLSAPDRERLNSLITQLKATGVIERAVEERDLQSLEELNEMVAEAVAAAKSERELNPDYYAPEVEAELGGDLSPEEDWENPALDGVGDYDERLFEDQRLFEVDAVTGKKLRRVRLSDGTVVLAEIL